MRWKGVPVQERRRMEGDSSCELEEDGRILQYRSMRGRQGTPAQESGGRGRIKNQTHTLLWGWKRLEVEVEVSPLSTFPGHPGFITSIRLLLSSCLSMYDNPSAELQ